METLEVWKDIPGYVGLYQVSNTGKVKSVKTNRLLKGRTNSCINGKGYYQVSLYPSKLRYYIHRLVAQAFVLNPNGYMTVDHKDRNRFNNNAENLLWVSLETNIGLSHNDPDYKFSNVRQYTLDWMLIAEYGSLVEALKKTGCPKGNISLACRNKRLTCGGFRWQFVSK